MWPDSGTMWKVEPTRLVEGLGVGKWSEGRFWSSGPEGPGGKGYHELGLKRTGWSRA